MFMAFQSAQIITKDGMHIIILHIDIYIWPIDIIMLVPPNPRYPTITRIKCIAVGRTPDQNQTSLQTEWKIQNLRGTAVKFSSCTENSRKL